MQSKLSPNSTQYRFQHSHNPSKSAFNDSSILKDRRNFAPQSISSLGSFQAPTRGQFQDSNKSMRNAGASEKGKVHFVEIINSRKNAESKLSYSGNTYSTAAATTIHT